MCDALLDTIQLVQRPASALELAAHVDYLRRLRLIAQHALAAGSALQTGAQMSTIEVPAGRITTARLQPRSQ
jgi:hypothetical protein